MQSSVILQSLVPRLIWQSLPLLTSSVPSDVVPHLWGATLLAACKKKGGHRLIAVGEVLCRLVSKCLAKAICAEAVALLSPLQVGVGLKAGCEAIVHAVNSVLSDPTIPADSCWYLLLDLENAFNSVDHGSMISTLLG